MINIDFESRTFKNALRFFTYGIMSAAVVGLTALVVLLALGYRFDRDQFGVIRDGLLQLASQPENVQYKINGKAYKDPTPGKHTLAAGLYTLEFFQTGYRPWKKDINIIAGHVHWINYPRLVPQDLQSRALKELTDAKFAKVSPDKRWMAVNPGGDRDKFQVIDFKDTSEPKSTTVTIPESQLTKKNGQLGELSFVEWALDSRSMLIKHTNGEIVEFVRVDRTKPDQAVNLNMEFQLPIDAVHFSGGDVNIVYARTKDGGILRRFDIAGNIVSGSLMKGVKQFEIFSDSTVVFSRVIQKEGGTADDIIQQVGLRLKEKDMVLKELPAEDDVIVNYTQYEDHTYFLIGNRSHENTRVYKDMEDVDNREVPFFEYPNIGPQFVSFNRDNRFIMMQQADHFGVYDFYEQRKYEFRIPVQEKSAAQWLDDYHLSGMMEGELLMWEFDGANIERLVHAYPGLDVLLDEQNSLLYTFTRAAEGSNTTRPYGLNLTPMKVTTKK